MTSGTTQNISWDIYETRKAIFKILLKHTKNCGRTCEKIKTIKGDDHGAYLWMVPTVSRAKKKCKIKIQLGDKEGSSLGSDTGDNYFRIWP